jgi:hypothetical protein
MKTITKEQYIRLFEGVENFIEKNLDWRTDQTLEKSFNEAYKGLLGKATNRESKKFKMSCKTRYLEMAEYDKVIKSIIIFKYTREDTLVITFDDGNKGIFKKDLSLTDIERSGY